MGPSRVFFITYPWYSRFVFSHARINALDPYCIFYIFNSIPNHNPMHCIGYIIIIIIIIIFLLLYSGTSVNFVDFFIVMVIKL
jgi:hypothetical protein